MARVQKNWHKNFIEYMEMIVNNQNYAGLPIDKKSDGGLAWLAPATSDIGKKRIRWCQQKAEKLGIDIAPGFFANVMLAIHPTKCKPCQVCGRFMSLYYHYPNSTFLKSLNNEFTTAYTTCDNINDIWDDLLRRNVPKIRIANFLIQKAALDLDPGKAEKAEIINALEISCRKGGKHLLGPGAMSNFPDRYDGFHSYNRCCRASQDKGRSKENLRSYTKDRRAYEYWSDGNIHAANQFMGSPWFKAISADHIGPISLGFVHDPRYLQPMSSGENSSKRDRLQLIDIQNIIRREKDTGIYPMSWQSKIIWEYIKGNYSKHPEKVPTDYRNALKQNMVNFMFILKTILESCPENGRIFLIRAFLEPKYIFFKYSYKFDPNGNIIAQMPRHVTGRNQDETERYVRIALDSVYEFNEKDNRNNKPDLTKEEINNLMYICNSIKKCLNVSLNKKLVVSLVESIEKRIINSL